MRRRNPAITFAACFAAPFVFYACTLPDYIYDDEAFLRAKGEAGAPSAGSGGQAAQGGTAGKSGAGSGGDSGKAGQGGAGQGGAGAGGVPSGGQAGEAGEAGAAGSVGGAGHSSGGASGAGSGGEAGLGGAGQAGISGASGQSGAGAGGAGAGGAGAGGAGAGGAGGSAGKAGAGAGAGGTGGSAGTAGAGAGGSAGSAGSAGGTSENICSLNLFNFDSGPQGFTSTGKVHPWEFGTPSIGPKGDHGGLGSLWGTRIASQPELCEDTFLESPELDLSAHAGKELRLRIWHWFEFRVCDPAGDFGFCGLACNPPIPIVPVESYSGGRLEVFDGASWKTLAPIEGYGSSGQTLFVNGGSGNPNDGGTPPCQDSSLDGAQAFSSKSLNKQWFKSTFNLKAFAKAGTKLRFHYASAPDDSCFPNKSGWFVDDVEVYYDGSCK